MRKQLTITILMLCTAFLCTPANAMKLDSNSIAEITTAPDHQVYGWQGNFSVWGDVAVWLDYRSPEFVNRAYGVNLNDPCYEEFIIDSNARDSSSIAMSGKLVVYKFWEADSDWLRVTDITNQNNPSMFELAPLIQNISYFDISGRFVTYSGSDPNNEWRQTVYAADVSDPCNIRQYTIAVLPTDDSVCGLTIDGNTISWSSDCYEPNGYVQVADISNPNEPNIGTAYLPEKSVFGGLDASGDWLVAQGRYDWENRIYGVHNYKDVNDWNVVTIWQESSEHYVSGPRIDGPITVWVTTTRMPSLEGQPGLQQEYEYLLKAAYMMGNGGFTVSTLLRGTDELGAADVSGKQVVWSKNMEGVTDLFKGAIELECGDWGYKRGDLDRNCKVDLMDFAIFANDWLGCTMPDDPDCGFGV